MTGIKKAGTMFRPKNYLKDFLLQDHLPGTAGSPYKVSTPRQMCQINFIGPFIQPGLPHLPALIAVQLHSLVAMAFDLQLLVDNGIVQDNNFIGPVDDRFYSAVTRTAVLINQCYAVVISCLRWLLINKLVKTGTAAVARRVKRCK